MQIGIIGSGNIGSALARLAVAAGFDIVITNRCGPASLAAFVADLCPQARAGTIEEVGRDAPFLIEAIPFGRLRELPIEGSEGHVLVTAANYFPGRDGDLDLGGTQSEYVARPTSSGRSDSDLSTSGRWRRGASCGCRAKQRVVRRAYVMRAGGGRPQGPPVEGPV